MKTKAEIKSEIGNYSLDEMVMITKIGNNYTEFKTCMEKYTRDWWF